MDAGLFWFLAFVTAVPAAIASFPLERKRREKTPGTKPYTWGTYLGLSTLLFGLVVLALFIAGEVAPWLWLLGVAWTAAGFAAMTRYRVGLIISALLSFNVVWWVVGSIYIVNRWVELSGTSSGGEPVGARKVHLRWWLLGVTERLNAATEERLKTGHAVGALSIV